MKAQVKEKKVVGGKHVPIYSNFKIINKIQFLRLPFFFYIRNRKIIQSKQTTASVVMLTSFYSKPLVKHHLYAAPGNSAGTAAPNSGLKQPFPDSSV